MHELCLNSKVPREMHKWKAGDHFSNISSTYTLHYTNTAETRDLM